ncbi:Uncharacterised protein [Pantoea agglomerans]|uniref:Uncharacterized protein n=1 Tax=Enterobacter agglomerans TaxID=549 RepID=A0A379LTK4_ENTAG|nr:Uncharacterised protein [Pantoea agglomerans]
MVYAGVRGNELGLSGPYQARELCEHIHLEGGNGAGQL